MKSMKQLLLFAVPLLALVAFFIVMKRWGGIAPASPVTETTIEVEAPTPRTAHRLPTVLAPQPSDESTLPPGMESHDPAFGTESPAVEESGYSPFTDDLEFSIVPPPDMLPG